MALSKVGERTMRALICALLLVTAACGSSSSAAPTPPPPTVTGIWSGALPLQTLTLQLNHSSGAVTGSGIITNTPTGDHSLSVSGTFLNPSLVVSMTNVSLSPVSFSGNLSGTSIIGVLNGGGFVNTPITLNKK